MTAVSNWLNIDLSAWSKMSGLLFDGTLETFYMVLLASVASPSGCAAR